MSKQTLKERRRRFDNDFPDQSWHTFCGVPQLPRLKHRPFKKVIEKILSRTFARKPCSGKPMEKYKLAQKKIIKDIRLWLASRRPLRLHFRTQGILRLKYPTVRSSVILGPSLSGLGPSLTGLGPSLSGATPSFKLHSGPLGGVGPRARGPTVPGPRARGPTVPGPRARGPTVPGPRGGVGLYPKAPLGSSPKPISRTFLQAIKQVRERSELRGIQKECKGILQVPGRKFSLLLDRLILKKKIPKTWGCLFLEGTFEMHEALHQIFRNWVDRRKNQQKKYLYLKILLEIFSKYQKWYCNFFWKDASGRYSFQLTPKGPLRAKNWAYTGLKIGIGICLFLGMPNFLFLTSFGDTKRFRSLTDQYYQPSIFP